METFRGLVRKWLVDNLNASPLYWTHIRHRRLENIWWALRAPHVSANYKEARTCEEQFYTDFFNTYNISRVFDIGGNNGDKTEIFLACGARHVALLEPDPYWLNIHKWRFSHDTRVDLCPFAVSSSRGAARLLRFYPGCPLNTLETKWAEALATGNERFQRQTITEVIEIATITFQQLIEKLGMPDYAKVDVEGHELEVLGGMLQAPKTMSLEFNIPEFYSEFQDSVMYLVEKHKRCRTNFVVDYKKGFECAEWLSPKEILSVLSASGPRYFELFVRIGADQES